MIVLFFLYVPATTETYTDVHTLALRDALPIFWPLTPFTADNGATHIDPNSHGAAGMAKADLGSPVGAACEPGSAICFLGSTAHGAGSNLSREVRRGLVIG